jgi:polo-like kinase 1
MERVVRTAMALSAGTESAAISTTAKAAPKSTLGSSSTSSDNNPGLGTGLSKFKSLYSCGFKIFDESSTASSKPPPSQPSRSIDEAALVQKTKSLSISTASEPKREELTSSSRSSHQAPAAYLSFASSSSGSVAADTEILQSMVNRLETALDVAGSRKGAYRLQLPRSVPPSYGPRKWVVRYVDYTSKYGLGFLLNDGSSGVYFNDSTKTVLGAEGDVFQYMERKYVDDPKDRQKVSKIPATTVETHTLSAYPESLKKKVTLLKHFRNYLMEQYKEENELFSATGCASQPASLVYVKKWVRTRHAILFRLSDHTVQVVFFDQSELLLTPDDRYITYVDKNRKRTTYPFTDELVGSSSEFETRIKYTKEILSSLLQRR